MNAPIHTELTYTQPIVPLLFAAEPIAPERQTSWRAVHERITRLAVERAGHERAVCRWLLAAARLDVAKRAGYASLHEYAQRVLGLTSRQTEERLRVGRALQQLPQCDAALAEGTLHFSAVRELTRVAQPRTERAWCDWARGKTVRDVERAVAQREPGALPSDRPDPSRDKHRLSFEVRGETMALFRDLQAAVRHDLGGGGQSLDDDALLFEIARRALEGPGDEGRASYQVAVSRCDGCKQHRVDAGGMSHAIDRAGAAMMACDAQHIGQVDSPHVGAANVGAAIVDTADVGAADLGAAEPKRASQTIPPATRRRVLRRDGKRCVVDGCRNHRYLDVHHVTPREEGGTHDPALLATLCGSHHRAVHRGQLVIEGDACAGFRFRHADGTSYAEPLTPDAADAADMAQQVFSALRHMGFKQTEARRRIDAVQQHGPPASIEEFLRAALHPQAAL